MKTIDLSKYHKVLIAARGNNVHLIPKDKPLFGVDPALCGVKPLMLGWAPAGESFVFLCAKCDREASQ